MDGITPGKTDSIIIGGGGRLKCGGQTPFCTSNLSAK